MLGTDCRKSGGKVRLKVNEPTPKGRFCGNSPAFYYKLMEGLFVSAFSKVLKRAFKKVRLLKAKRYFHITY